MTGSLMTPRFVFAWFASLAGGLAFFLFVHFPGYLESLGASEVEIGVIVATTALAAVLVRPQIGKEMDRTGRRPMILAGNTLNIVVLALYLTVSSLGPWIYVVRAIHGVAEAMVFASIFTYAADLLPDDNRTQGLALFGISGMLPIALGGLIGDFILTHWDFDALFLTSVALAAVALVLTLPLTETVKPAGRSAPVSFLDPLRQGNLVPIWWITVVFSVALTGYFTFLKTFVNETGIGSVGSFFAAYATTAIVLRLTTSWVPDRVGPKRVLYPALVLFAAGFAVLATATSDAAVVAAGTMCGAGHGYVFPIMYALAFGRADLRNRGSASAIFTGLFDVGALVGGPVLGALISLFGYKAMFFTAAAWVLVGGFAFAIWDDDLKRTTRVSLG